MLVFQSFSVLETFVGLYGPTVEMQFGQVTKTVLFGDRGVLSQLNKYVMGVLMVGLVICVRRILKFCIIQYYTNCIIHLTLSLNCFGPFCRFIYNSLQISIFRKVKYFLKLLMDSGNTSSPPPKKNTYLKKSPMYFLLLVKPNFLAD